MNRLVLSTIVGIAASAAHATECPVPISPEPVPIMSAGAIGTTGQTSITATLSPRATRAVVNLTGFEVTILGGINGVVLTINGLIGGTITYYIPVDPAGNGTYNLNFPCPLTGIPKTNVVATLATIASGARFGEAALATHGFSRGIRPE